MSPPGAAPPVARTVAGSVPGSAGGPGVRSAARSAAVKASPAIAADLRERLLDGEFPPGTPLPPTDDLVAEFGVSRPTVLEALRFLEQDGLVRLRRGPRGGALALVPDAAATTRALDALLRSEGTTLDQLMEVRVVVDPLAARLAARRAGPGDLSRLRDSLERQGRPEVLADQVAWFAENLRFHAVIAEASGNPVVRVLSESLQALIMRHGSAARYTRADRLRSTRQHAAILAAVVARDAPGAERADRLHLESSRRRARRR